MFKTFQYLYVVLLCALVLSCTRSFDNKAPVSLSIPKLNQISSSSQCSGTCLKFIIIKIEGTGFDKIVTKNFVSHLRDSSEVSGEFKFEIPPGDHRKFKVAAIYVLGGKLIFAYGETSVNLPDTTAKTIDIEMITQGEIHGGSLVGRYITGQDSSLPPVDSGPTGTVDIILNYNSDPDFDMLIGQTQILNGWFDFMASENLEMTYKISSQNLVLFEKQSINTLIPITGSSTVNHRARLVTPSSYYRNNGTAAWDFVNERHDIIYGFFGNSNFLSGKFVCFEYTSTLSSFTNVSTNPSGGNLMTYSPSSSAAHFYGIGGFSSNTTECAGSVQSDRFTADRISINKIQLDGKGNDTAKAFGNSFTYLTKYINPSYNIQKFKYEDGIFSLKTLPGLFGSAGSSKLFNSLQLFKKPNSTTESFDEIQCTSEWLNTNNFVSVPISTLLSGDLSAVSFSLLNSSDVSSTDGTVACPTKDINGVQTLQTIGGFDLGGLLYSNLTGPTTANITTPSPGFVYITITNTGNKTAQIISGTLPGGTISFFSGSFSSAGNCTSPLAPGASCQIKLIATTAGAVANLTVSYEDGTLSIPITSN